MTNTPFEAPFNVLSMASTELTHKGNHFQLGPRFGRSGIEHNVCTLGLVHLRFAQQLMRSVGSLSNGFYASMTCFSLQGAFGNESL